MGRLFGTDGVRGVANKELSAELAFKLGRAGAAVLTKDRVKPRIVIGRDTRISGAMLEAALVAGITSVGVDVVLLGVVPTPAVAYLTRHLQADAGVMISASHNPVEDNGIKFFAASGFKLPDKIEDEIEALLESSALPCPVGAEIGQVEKYKNASDDYATFLINTVPVDLTGMHVALDCANGAAYWVAPQVLRELGAKVTVINEQPSGININVECGSTHPEVIQQLVRECGADVGITHDGDADRVLAVDHNGELVDGDQILTICGLDLLHQNQLPNNKVAATVYSNGGLRKVFQEAGGDVVITAAGDRYVLESMVEQGLALGGEQSGHIIFLKHNTTGDGVLTALKLLEVLTRTKKTLADLKKEMPVFPQLLVNIRVAKKDGWDTNSKIKDVVAQAEQRLSPDGRLFVRASGTEPLIRVMGEHPDRGKLNEVVQSVAEVIRSEQGD